MWNDIINNPTDVKYVHTLKEILQQPECWEKTGQLILENKSLEKFLTEALKDKFRPIIVSGAGSSEFAAKSILDTLSTRLNRRVLNAASTDIVINPDIFSIPNEPALMISFARSGNSPESVASVELVRQICPTTKHLIITCNNNGALAKMKNENTFCIILPDETNDQSLVMTSSFSSMILAAVLCSYFTDKEYAYRAIEQVCQYTKTIFTSVVEQLELIMKNPNIERIQYLGSSDAYGLLTEGHLKMLEMTDGRIATRIDSFLGLRHGPQVFVNKNTVVVAILSIDPYVRKYEIDMLRELKSKNQGYAYIVIGNNPNEVELLNLVSYSTGECDNFFRLLPSIVIVQMLGFFKSLYLGLSPDVPSNSGIINRVVQGVIIYPFNK